MCLNFLRKDGERETVIETGTKLSRSSRHRLRRRGSRCRAKHWVKEPLVNAVVRDAVAAPPNTQGRRRTEATASAAAGLELRFVSAWDAFVGPSVCPSVCLPVRLSVWLPLAFACMSNAAAADAVYVRFAWATRPSKAQKVRWMQKLPFAHLKCRPNKTQLLILPFEIYEIC